MENMRLIMNKKAGSRSLPMEEGLIFAQIEESENFFLRQDVIIMFLPSIKSSGRSKWNATSRLCKCVSGTTFAGYTSATDVLSAIVKPILNVVDQLTTGPVEYILTLLPTLYARSLIGNRFPLMYANMAGGFTKGRYIDQQIPFRSIRFGVFNGKNMGIAALEGRILLLKRNYLSLRGEYMVDTGSFKDFDHVFGGVVSYGLNTIAGPVSASIGWSSLAGVTAYLSLGYDF